MSRLQCLFSRCGRPAHRIDDLGLGFTFCTIHEENMRKTLREGVTRDVDTGSTPGVMRYKRDMSRPARRCKRGHLIDGPNYGHGGSCRSCKNARSTWSKNTDIDQAAYADMKYSEYMPDEVTA